MPSVTEAAGFGSQLEAALAEGLGAIDRAQQITFVSYTRQVLPLDGFVFWLRAGEIQIEGSLHYAVDKRQNEDETLAINRVIFTTTEEVQAFNLISPTTIFVAQLMGGTSSLGQYLADNDSAGLPIFRAAFSRRDAFYKSAGLYHYVGDAVYPALASQLIDDGEALAATTLVVSNSLPAWLSLSSYKPAWLAQPNPTITLFPSFAVPDNIAPPYGVVHIDPARTEGLQSAPSSVVLPASGIGALQIGVSGVGTLTHSRLAVDRVRVTLYSVQNAAALTFVDLVDQYSLDTDAIGIMNIPVVRDEKRTQAEIGVLAMKKTVEWEVSYNQSQMTGIATQLITSAAATFTVGRLTDIVTIL